MSALSPSAIEADIEWKADTLFECQADVLEVLSEIEARQEHHWNGYIHRRAADSIHRETLALY